MFVGASYEFFQGDVVVFGDQEFRINASELEVFHHGSGNLTVVLVLPEASVGRAFASGQPVVLRDESDANRGCFKKTCNYKKKL